jgi:flagellar motor protein MotB
MRKKYLFCYIYKMKNRNEPISCNDLIITLLITAILIFSTFAWLYFRGEETAIENINLLTEIELLNQSDIQKQNSITTLSSEMTLLTLAHKHQSIKLSEKENAINSHQTTNQQLKTTYEQDKQQLQKSIIELQGQLKDQQSDITQFKQIQSKDKTLLQYSEQSLHESRVLSEQQFNEFKQLKRNFIQTQRDADNRLKEINEWQLEVKKLKKQLTNTQIKMSQPKQRFSVFEMDQDILFNQGATTLKAEGIKALSTLADIFKQYPKRQIAIQGHSDSQSLGFTLKKKYKSNWELAAARAASAIYYLQNTQSIAPQRITLVSYAHYRPTTQGHSQKD